MVAGIYFILRTGVPWRDLPKEFGPWQSVYTRFRRWCEQGLWTRVLEVLSQAATGSVRHFDCSHVKVHQHGSNGAGSKTARAIGMTKGGLNTKVAAVVDAIGRVTSLSLAPGNRHDLKAIEPLLEQLRGCWAVGDRGFDAGNFRSVLAAQNTISCIPPRASNRIQYHYSQLLFKHRHHVENFFGRIKALRRVGTRYEKLAKTFLGFLTIAAIVDWISFEV